MALHHQDGGYASRKLHLAYVSLLCIIVGALLAAHWPAFAAQFTAYVGGVISVLGVYSGVNVANSYVVGKTVGLQEPQSGQDNAEQQELPPAHPTA